MLNHKRELDTKYLIGEIYIKMQSNYNYLDISEANLNSTELINYIVKFSEETESKKMEILTKLSPSNINKLFTQSCQMIKELNYDYKIIGINILEHLILFIDEEKYSNAYSFEKNLISLSSTHIKSKTKTIGTKNSKHFNKHKKINSNCDYQLKFENDLGSYYGFFASALDDERRIIKKKTLSLITKIILIRKFDLFAKKSFSYIIELIHDEEEDVRIHTVKCLKDILSVYKNIPSEKIDILYSVLNDKNSHIKKSTLEVLTYISFEDSKDLEKFIILMIELRKISKTVLLTNATNSINYKHGIVEDTHILSTIMNNLKNNKENILKLKLKWIKDNLGLKKSNFLIQEYSLDDFSHKVFMLLLLISITHYKQIISLDLEDEGNIMIFDQNSLFYFNDINEFQHFKNDYSSLSIPLFFFKHWRYYSLEHPEVFVRENIENITSTTLYKINNLIRKDSLIKTSDYLKKEVLFDMISKCNSIKDTFIIIEQFDDYLSECYQCKFVNDNANIFISNEELASSVFFIISIIERLFISIEALAELDLISMEFKESSSINEVAYYLFDYIALNIISHFIGITNKNHVLKTQKTQLINKPLFIQSLSDQKLLNFKIVKPEKNIISHKHELSQFPILINASIEISNMNHINQNNINFISFLSDRIILKALQDNTDTDHNKLLELRFNYNNIKQFDNRYMLSNHFYLKTNQNNRSIINLIVLFQFKNIKLSEGYKDIIDNINDTSVKSILLCYLKTQFPTKFLNKLIEDESKKIFIEYQ